MVPGKPNATGRILEQDPRSLDYLAPKGPVASVRWAHHGPVLDQGRTRTCCSQAMTQVMNCAPLHRPPVLDEARALGLHGRTTRLDDYLNNEWPEFNQGSSILAAAKAAVEAEWITGYQWAKGVDHLKSALQHGPLVLGTPWFTGMLEPGTQGVVRAVGKVEFWHAWVVIGYDRKQHRFTGLGSWSSNWADRGFFCVGEDSMEILLDGTYQSDALLPVRSATLAS